MTTFKFSSIRQFTRASKYSVTVGWDYLERHIEHQREEGFAPLDLEPDFQRAHVWDDLKRMRYVEYVLRGGMSGRDLYFNCAGWMGDWRGPYVVVDGKQRLEAVRQFLGGKIPVHLPELSDGGIYYSEFSDRPRITRCNFTWHVNDLESRAECLQWYLDLNAGGVAHTQKELDRVRGLLKEESKAPKECKS